MLRDLPQSHDLHQMLRDLPTEYLLELYKNKTVIKNPELKVIYQDTDSNYCEMRTLYEGKVKQQYLEQERYVQTTTSGLYNNLFCEAILTVMSKYPLKFNFEGAFYMAYYIAKKNYLGQKIPAVTCKVQDNKIIPTYDIKKEIKMDDYDGSDIGKYLDSKHIKVVGLKLIKRNTILLSKKKYLEMICNVLNGGKQYQREQQLQSVAQIMKQIHQGFDQLNIDDLTERKKVSKKWLDSNSSLVQKYQLGLGDSIYTYYAKPQDIDDDLLLPATYKKSDYIIIHKVNDKIQTNQNAPHRSQYVYNVLSNLLRFIDNDIDDKFIKQFALTNGLIQKKKLQYITLTTKTQQYITQLFDELLQQKQYGDDVVEHNGCLITMEQVLEELKRRLKNSTTQKQIQKITELLKRYVSAVNEIAENEMVENEID